ncbi:MAG: amidohydrolase family protein [Bacteroidales bacterium]|nr:amidohydrolase family protein [Bacteroidales bacterium]
MIIDGHSHQGGEYRDIQSIISLLDRFGVDKVVLCPADSERNEPISIPGMGKRFNGPELNFVINRFIRAALSRGNKWSDIERSNKKVYEIASLSGGRILQFYWINPLKEGISGDLEEKLNLWKFAGIKLHQACHPFVIRSGVFSNIAEFAASKNLPVFIHLYSKKDVMDFISVSGSFRANFIAGHLIGLEIYIKEKKVLGDNVYFDISCPSLVSADRIALAIKEFGANRIIMGSDTPYGKNNLKQVLTIIRSLNLNENEKEMILGNNLNNILPV